MKHIVLILHLTLTVVLSGLAQAQDPAIDSLRNVISTTKSDTIKAEAIMELAWQRMYSHSREAKELVADGLEVMTKIDNLRVKGYGYTVAGVVYWVSASYDSATMYLAKAADTYVEKGDDRGLSAVYNNLSLANQNQGKYPEALDYATKALEIAEKMENHPMLAAATFTVGNIHYLIKDNRKALSTYLKALRMYDEHKLTQNLQKLHLNIGSSLHNLDKPDSAAIFYQKALGVARQIQDFKTEAIVSTNLGNLAMDVQNPAKAIDYYALAEEIYREKFSNDYDHSLLLHSLAKAHLALNNHQGAQKYALSSLDLAQKINDASRISAAHQVLSNIYEAQSNYEAALMHFKSATALKDSIFNLDKTSQLAEIETKYETAIKDRTISAQQLTILEKEKSLQKTFFLILLLALAILAVLIIYFLARSRQKKERLLMQQEKELQVKEAYIHAALESQEKERKRFAQDLHDGFGQLISALRLHFSNLQSGNVTLEKRMETVEKSEKLLHEMHTEIRNIAFNLMPATLIQFGLKAALEEFRKRLNSTGKVYIILDTVVMDIRLSEVLEISLYRIIQEWVNNILKYANAGKINIQLIRDEKELTLMIEDDGDGFDIQTLTKGSGNGWRNIQSRLSRIQASIEVDSKLGVKGTTFIIDVPISQTTTFDQFSAADPELSIKDSMK